MEVKDSGKRLAVVGAGVMGLCAARALGQVTLFDAGGPNASAMAGGMLAPWSEIEHLPAEFLGAAKHGIKFWSQFPSFKPNGTLIVAHKDDDYILERFAQKLPDTSRTKVAAIEPDLARFGEGIFLSEEAHIEPHIALQSLMPPMMNESIDIKTLQNKFDFVIDCRGIAAAKDDKNLRGVKGEIAVVRNTGFNLSRPVRLMHPRYPLYIVPRENNVFMIGATVIESDDTAVTVKSALELLSAAYSLHPSFGEAEILDIQSGVRPAYPDNLPRVTVDGNMIRCNGLFRHGYLLAPAMANCVADLVDGRDNQFISLFMRGHSDEHHDQRTEKVRQLRA